MATVLAAAALLLGTAAPASAAEGRLLWTANDGTWHEYTPPDYDVCHKPVYWTHTPARRLVNETNVPIEVFSLSDCMGASDTVEPGETSSYVTRSAYIPAA